MDFSFSEGSCRELSEHSFFHWPTLCCHSKILVLINKKTNGILFRIHLLFYYFSIANIRQSMIFITIPINFIIFLIISPCFHCLLFHSITSPVSISIFDLYPALYLLDFMYVLKNIVLLLATSYSAFSPLS